MQFLSTFRHSVVLTDDARRCTVVVVVVVIVVDSKVHFSQNPVKIGNEREGVLCFVSQNFFSIIHPRSVVLGHISRLVIGAHSYLSTYVFEKQSGKLLPVVQCLTPYGAIIIFFPCFFSLSISR